jgi:hypothetical protein
MQCLSRSITWRAALAMALVAATVPAQAANTTFTDQAAFLAATPGLVLESFEALAGSARGPGSIVTAGMTLVPGGAPIGVQTGADTPSEGFGAAATDGTHYISVYAPNAAPGTLTFNLARPATAFGLFIIDAGETAGFIRLGTDTGAYAAGVDIHVFSRDLGNGRRDFAGLVQDQAFTQVTLTLSGLDEAYGVDAVYTNAVPEPGAAWSLAAGLAGLGWLLRRRPQTLR